MAQYVGLIDCNNFFVSCERLFRPDLKQRPVVVLSSNDGCVVARSQEIKDSGIPMGIPYFQVKDTLSHMGAVVFSSNFRLYRDISRRVFSIARRELNQIEQYSIDEAFFLIEQEGALPKIQELRLMIEREVGVPVSIGLGLSKTLAKYATLVSKRTTGVELLEPTRWQDYQTSVKLSDIWGVGRARAKQFAARSLTTVADYLTLSRIQARSLFGVEGERLWAELTGDRSSLCLGKQKLQSSLMSTRSFAAVTHEEGVVRSALLYHLHHIVHQLSNMEALAASMRVIAYPNRFSDFALRGIVEEVVFTVPTRDLFTLTREVDRVLKQGFRRAVPYKKAGIIVAVVPEAGISGQLFETEETTARTKSLSEVIVGINKAQGKNSIQLGTSLGQWSRWSARTEKLSPAYTTDWSDLRVVHT